MQIYNILIKHPKEENLGKAEIMASLSTYFRCLLVWLTHMDVQVMEAERTLLSAVELCARGY